MDMQFSRSNTKKLFIFSAVAFLFLFLLFSFFVRGGYLLAIDRTVNFAMTVQKSSLVFYYSKILEYLYIFLIVLTFRALYKFYKKKEKLELLLLSITAFFSVFPQFFVKPLFSILCPGSYYNSVFVTYPILEKSPFFQNLALNETCYPSNHTIGYIVICGYLALLMKTYYPKRREANLLVALLVFIALTVGYTRLYLHVHWFSDVVAAYFLGGCLLSIIFWMRLHRIEFKRILKVGYEKLAKIKNG